jgi:hypothetical protein
VGFLFPQPFTQLCACHRELPGFFSVVIHFFLIYSNNWCLNDTGEVVGSLSFSVGHGANMLKKVASVRMLNQPHNVQNMVSYPLRRRVSYLVLFIYACLCN